MTDSVLDETQVALVPEDTYVCNCGLCGQLLIGTKSRLWYKGLTKAQRRAVPPMMVARLLDRPVCGQCLNIKKQSAGGKKLRNVRAFLAESDVVTHRVSPRRHSRDADE